MTNKTVVKLLLILILGILLSCSRRNPWDNPYLYTYTYRYFLYFGNNYNGSFGDIFQYEINMTTGDLTYIASCDTGNESAWLAVDPSSKYLYSEQPSGHAIRSFVIASDGSLGSAASWNLGYPSNGMISVHPNGNFLYGTSLAGNNIYDVNILPAGSLGSVAGSSNSLTDAPKVFAIKPTGEFAYVVNYNNSTINRYLIDAATGAITTPITAFDIIGTGALPQAIAIHPTMDYLYVVTDAAQTIQSYSINSGTGLLTVNGGTVTTSAQGDSCLVIDPSGKYLYCVNSWGPSTIDAYKINPADGTLSMIGGSPYPVPHSTAANIVMQYIVIDPTGKYLYGTIYDGTSTQGYIEGYNINQATGELAHFNSWTYPHYMAANPVIVAVKQ